VLAGSGSPAVGATVEAREWGQQQWLDSTTTGADGSYSLAALAGHSYQLVIIYGGGGVHEEPLTTKPVLVGEEGATENFSLPAIGTLTLEVLEASGQPAAGISVAGPGSPEFLQGETEQGLTFQTEGADSPECGNRTDSQGRCVFKAMAGTSLQISVQPPGGFAQFTNGTASIEGNTVQVALTDYASLESRGASEGKVGLTSPLGSSLSSLTVEAISVADLPEGAVAVVGGLGYSVGGLKPGETISVTLHLPEGSDPTNIFKYEHGQLVDVSSLATIVGDTVTLRLTDGGLGDSDGIANGTIVDPLVPVRFSAVHPSIASVSPNGGVEGGGTAVTISGTSLSGAKAVLFGPKAATSFKVISPTAITAIAPAGNGVVDVSVTTAGGTSGFTPSDRYSYRATETPPVVSKLSVKKGPAAGGNAVTITGVGLMGATGVKFGSTAASSFKASGTAITAVAPAGAGTVDVTVTTAGGTSAISTKDHYTYEAVPVAVTGMSPSHGPIAGGTTVTVTGTGFALGSSTTTFTFTGKAAGTSVNCTSTTSCRVVSPAAKRASTVNVIAAVGTTKSKKNPPGDQFSYG